MLSANLPARPNRIPGTLDLEISDPAFLLNEVARRYTSTERILMEYVDNALDDAEVLYRESGNRYPYPINIDIIIDTQTKRVVIKDNCRGMSRQLLERLVKNIGESQKRGIAWVNGRFGFGVQAFRAAAESIQFQTKQSTSSHYTLSMNRNQHYGIKEAKRIDDSFPTANGTGTIVVITDFDKNRTDFSAESVKAEIEKHFERLIARPGLTITVAEAKQPPVTCEAFDYNQLEGQPIRQTFEIDHQGQTYRVEAHLVVTQKKMPAKTPGFFLRGRRINDVVQIKSFIRKSQYKITLWGHPNLVGWLEVGDIVQPAIIRDDFNRTKGRQLCYEAILTLEPEINKLMNQVNKTGKDKTLGTLENAVNQAAADAPTVKLVAQLPQTAPGNQRACRVGQEIYINIEHPDFKARLATTRQGAPKITDRANAYLASLLSVYQLKQTLSTQPNPADIETILDKHIDGIIKLEADLHQQRAARAKKPANK